MALQQMRDALPNRNVQAFLRVIREGESSQEVEAYRWLFGSTRGEPRLFDAFGDHPRQRTYEKYDGQFIRNNKIDYTTAAGAYQITETTWDTVIQPAVHLPDFSPASQDLAAVYLLLYRKALEDVVAGRFDAAIAKLPNEWASMPGASHGDQPTQGYARALAIYKHYGGALDGQESAGEPIAPAPIPTQPPPARAPPAPSIPAGEAPDWPPPPAPENTMPMPSLIGALFSNLLGAFAPLAQEKINREIGRHTDSPEIAGQVAAAVMQTIQTATGKADPIEAVAAAKASPEVLKQAEESALDTLDRMAPLLDKMHQWDRDAFALEDASRDAAAARARAESYDLAPLLLYGAFTVLGLLILMVGVIVAAQVVKSGSPDTATWATLTGLIGWATGIGTMMYAYRFGGTTRTTAAGIVRDELKGRNELARRPPPAA